MVVLAAALLVAGCIGTAAKQAYYGVTGASGRYFEVRTLGGSTSLLKYLSAQVEAFDPAPMLGVIPREVVTAVRPVIARELTEPESFRLAAGGRPALLVRGKFVDYDPGGAPLRAVGFGVDPFLTAQIEIVDADSGHVLGVAMVTGTVKSAVRVGPNELADGLAKAVKGLLEAHMKAPK